MKGLMCQVPGKLFFYRVHRTRENLYSEEDEFSEIIPIKTLPESMILSFCLVWHRIKCIKRSHQRSFPVFPSFRDLPLITTMRDRRSATIWSPITWSI